MAHPPRRTRLVAALACVVAVAAASTAAAAPDRPPAPAPRGLAAGSYVVVLTGAPAATYEGGVRGLAATAPGDGERLRAGDRAVREYREHLDERQREVADGVGAEPRYRYTVAVNGFAAELSAEQAAELTADPRVLAVVPDVPRAADTVASPEFLGLTGDDGVWSQVGGAAEAGRGVVVGVIDTGIWPESASFAGPELADGPTGEPGVAYRTSDTGTAVLKANGDTFTGECETGENWTADLCNGKLVSARYYDDGFVANVPPEHRDPNEHLSTRDGDGHGSHTASTAAGNHGVPMSVNGREFGDGSGMAPGASVAAYKVCWQDDDENTGGCYPSDSVAAIDQAILDGVDVINYSISGATDTLIDPVELAFLSAASANVFVSASAGNSGPGESTVAHNSPWVTTVAASTHQIYEGSVELGDGRRFRGSMISDTGLPEQTPLVDARDIAAAGVEPDEAALCGPSSLDAAAAAGAVVICDRGVHDRVAKSAEVQRAGGVAVVLGNLDPAETLNADFHVLPTTHVGAEDAAAIREYAAGDGATAALLPGDLTDLPPTPKPVLAGFSSRGPALANGGDLLKPDISAPGVDVLAAVAPWPHAGNDFDFVSGTSMAAPHVAGLAALIRAEQPGWSAATVRSAMMTTAHDLVVASGEPDRDRFHAGAGHVDPARFLEPGLVYESGTADWLAFLEGTGEDTGVAGVEPIDPSDLNQPSIAVGALAGRQTVTRTVTAVTPGLYRASVSVPGFTARVTPSELYFGRPGQSKTFEVTLTRTRAALDEYAHGTLTWSGAGTTVRSPIVARPVAVAAPAEVAATAADGSATYSVTTSTTGDVDLTLRGLVPGTVTDGSLTPGEAPDPAGNASSQVMEFEVPEGTSLARFDLVAASSSADYDLYLYGPDGAELPVNGATGAASERVDLTAPEPGTYTALVHLFSSPDGGPVDFSLRSFAVGADATGTATVAPDPLPARPGDPAEVTVAWSGLEPGVPYLGLVGYAATSSTTVIAID
ncbi:S8 family serine peptidase [Jiangella sp. DSM 45060]|uniref:S8 family serine peptidase n=1 Tax=Jiangella sp. DSM 45060 TaxID=1798224 RepID=UPI00087A9CEC|nr:S8 family serine peptidase [Jiangella sp. DSM 45060]SDS91397.1 pre-peptidase C-terminal domain-containing protein [Jiangella sp. DSM 45060]